MRREQLYRLKHLRGEISREKKRLSAEADSLARQVAIEEECEKILSKLTQASSERLAVLIESALAAVYGRLSVKRVSKSLTIQGHDLVHGHGGGMKEIISSVLRLMAVIQGRGGSLRTLILDEPFGAIDAKIRPRFLSFYKNLCSRFGLNLLIVTHDKLIVEAADKVYHFSKLKGKTICTEVRDDDVRGDELY